MPSVDTSLVSANHIAPAGAGISFEPQRVQNWTLVLTPPQGMGVELTRVIQLSLSTFTPPTRTVEVLTIAHGNEERKVASRVKYDAVTLALRDYIDKDTYGVLWQWQERVHNSFTGAIGYAYQYKGTGELWLLHPNGMQRTRRFYLYGVWPSKISPSELNQAASENLTVSVELQVDYMTSGTVA